MTLVVTCLRVAVPRPSRIIGRVRLHVIKIGGDNVFLKLHVYVEILVLGLNTKIVI